MGKGSGFFIVSGSHDNKSWMQAPKIDAGGTEKVVWPYIIAIYPSRASFVLTFSTLVIYLWGVYLQRGETQYTNTSLLSVWSLNSPDQYEYNYYSIT